ncbi:MAG: serine/threonine protein kinase [Phycisphaerae bacterium]|nr:serine/threonine protein kinase [Phycisphaerae bacterium]
MSEGSGASDGRSASATRWDRITELFGDALERPPSERAAFLRSASPDDLAIVAEVNRLLGAHERLDRDPTGFLDSPLDGALPAMGPDVPESDDDRFVGRTVGRYRVLRRIATGGMGTVFEAEQSEPLRRVALKVVRGGLASPELASRLSREAQALSRLRHPNIAKVFDAGRASVEGRDVAYLAMDLVEGESLTEAASRGEWSDRDRARLIADVADAVQHAHDRGVIHRDLKPSNVLVDAARVPHVLDFGIARLLESDEGRAYEPTAPGVMLGTIRYMSPEQLASGADAVDTRTDVYSLGVMAYELLSGRLPFDAPSGSMVTQFRAQLLAMEHHEALSLRRVAPRVGRDLECIVMRAIARDPANRYASARDLALDLRRWLAGDAIDARPPSAGYRLRKFLRRHRGLVAAVLAVTTALATGVVLYAREAEKARASARREAAAARASAAVSEFLVGMLSSIDPNRGTAVDIPTLVGDAAKQIAKSFAERPIERAAVHNEVGTIYYNLRHYPEASVEYGEALRLREAELGPDSEATLDSVNALGQSLAQLNRPDEAEPLYQRALEGRSRLLGPSAAKTLVVRNNLAVLLEGRGDRAGAERELRAVLDAQQAALGVDHDSALVTLGNLAGLLRRDRRFDVAHALRVEAFEGWRRVHGANHAMTAIAENAVAQSLHDLGRLDEADARFRSARDGLAATLGPQSRDTAVAENNWGLLLVDANRHDEAIERFAAARAIHEVISGREHRVTLGIAEREALAELRAKRFDAAAGHFAELVARCGRTFGAGHERTVDAMLGQAEALVAAGRGAEAGGTVQAVHDLLQAHPDLDVRKRRSRLEALKGNP